MTIATAGMALAIFSLVLLLAFAIPLFVRFLEIQKRAAAVQRRPGFRALSGLQAQGERIGASVLRLQAVSDRFADLGAEIASLAESGSRWAADVKLVARATEDLLEAFVPSLRGVARERRG